jgi:type I restriction enzyme, S subunit
MTGPSFEQRLLGDCAQFFSGGTPSKSNPSYWKGSTPWVSCKDMKVPRLYDAKDHLSEEGCKNGTRLIQPGTILIVVRGMILAKEFPVAMAMREVAFNQDLKALRCKDGVDSWFLYFWLLANSYEVLGLVDEAAHGTKRLQSDRLLNLEVNLPHLETQRKIASILSTYDDLIENNTRRIKILEEQARMIYREWFVNFRFPGHEQVKTVDSQIGKIPKGWEVVTVEQVIRRMSAGKKYDNKTVSPTGTVPVLDQGKSGIIGYHNDEPGVIASEENPIIVFANHTCYQHLIQFPFSAIQNVLPFLSSKENQRNIYWLHWATKDLIQFNDYKGHWPEFNSKELLLPDTKTCDSFGAFVRPVVKFIYKMELKNQNLRQTRDLLLPKLISGEVAA